MGNCCNTGKTREGLDVNKITKKVTMTRRVQESTGNGRIQNDNEFKWCLEERLRKELKELYSEKRELIEDELETESEEEDLDLMLKNAQGVQEGIYEGNWSKKSGQRIGEGRVIYHNGTFYHGKWERNLPNGIGLKIFPNQDVYFGDFVDGKMEGFGQYFMSDGSIYEGDFVRDLYEGEGFLEMENGTTYKGTWKKGKRHGNGKLILASGNSYKGGFK